MRRLRSLPLLFALASTWLALGTAAAEVAAIDAGAPGSVPFREGSVLSTGAVLRVVGVTAGGVLLVWLGAHALRRSVLGPSRAVTGERGIEVLETQRLSPRASVVLLRVRDREVLVGQSGENLVVLHEREADGNASPSSPR